MLSYISVIIIILSISFFMAIRGLKRLESRNLLSAREGVEDVVENNIVLTQEVLTRVGEHFVVLRSHSLSLEFKLFLEKNKALLSDGDGNINYDVLRNNSEAREIFSQKILTPGYPDRIAGHVDLFDLNGEAVIHPNKSVEGKNYSIWKDKYPKMWELVKRSFTQDHVHGYYSFVDNNNNTVNKFMSLDRVQGTPFIVAAVVEINKYFIPIEKRIKQDAKDIKVATDSDIAEASKKTLGEIIERGVLFSLALLIVGVVLGLWQASSTSRPIRDLSKKVRQIGEGDFSVKVMEQGSLEIKELGSVFNSLGRKLSDYMENLKREVAARESIESEIKIARHIQETLIPHSFPAFPDRDEFDLFASLVPAKDMSGDFYDFFFVDSKTLAVLIADVSGKGLPAAIFMAVSRTLLRNLCLNSGKQSPAEIFTAANSFLCMENEESMFVTAFLAYIDVETGELRYANAGHNPFLSLKYESSGVQEMGALCDLPLGIMENYEYASGEYRVSEGEKLLFYTDGVTEATSPDGEFYGTERFYALLSELHKCDVMTLIEKAKDDVVNYQSDHQFDDITLMAFQRNSKGQKS